MSMAASCDTQEPNHKGSRTLDYLSTIVDMLNIGVLAVDNEGRVIFANLAAKELLECHNVRRDGASRHPYHRGESLQNPLLAAISSRQHDSGHMSLGTGINKSLIVKVAPMRGGTTACAGEVATVLFISDPSAKPSFDLRPVARLYQLTSAEARILDALLRGKRVGEYAKEARITLNTAKGYLKQLFSKTGTSRQSDLMRLVLTNPLLAVVSTTHRGDA
jgi:DNA-binding CsgD family transcriptional regulator